MSAVPREAGAYVSTGAEESGPKENVIAACASDVDGTNTRGRGPALLPDGHVRPRVFPHLAVHEVPKGSVVLALGGEGKTHVVQELLYRWHAAGSCELLYCFGPRAAQEYWFALPEHTFAAFCDRSVDDLVERRQKSKPAATALVVVDGCFCTSMHAPAMCRLFEGARAAKLRVVVTGPLCAIVPQHLRAHVDLCLLLHTHNWAHRKLCFVQWGWRAFESLRAFDRAFDSLTDDFACMVLGRGPLVAWYRAAPVCPWPRPAKRAGWPSEPTPQVPPHLYARRPPVSARALDTRAVAVVGPPDLTVAVVRSLAYQWHVHGVRSLGHRTAFFESVCCFTERPEAFDFVPPRAHRGRFELARLQALMDDRRRAWARNTARNDHRRPFLCIVDRCTVPQLAQSGFQDAVANAALFGLHVLLLVDADVVVPRTLLCAFDTCMCVRDMAQAHHALACRQWLPHFDTLGDLAVALATLPSPASCLVAEYAGPCFMAGVYHTPSASMPFSLPCKDSAVDTLVSDAAEEHAHLQDKVMQAAKKEKQEEEEEAEHEEEEEEERQEEQEAQVTPTPAVASPRTVGMVRGVLNACVLM